MDRNAFVEGNGRPGSGCPKCGQEQNCPCAACLKRGFTKPDEIVWKWTEDGNSISCGKCGWTADADVWQDLEYEYMRSRGGWGE